MNAYDYAIQLEQDGYEFYTQSAQKVTDPAAKRMLIELAEDEKVHEDIILDMKNNEVVEIADKISGKVKNVFEKLVENKKTLTNGDGTLAEVLSKGAKLEGEAADLYQGFADKAETENEKETWLKLRDIELKHEKLLSMALEYIEEPHVVLEDAEFLFYDHDEAP